MRFLLAALIVLSMLLPACGQPGDTAGTPAPTSPPEEDTAFAEARKMMVKEQLERRGISDPEVLAAMAAVPRHKFVPKQYLDEAYADHPLPIGHGQTISQPYVVALMTEHLALQPGEKVLEVGTGSGYQAAVLAELSDEVYSIEIIEPLGKQAASTLKALGYNVHCEIGDGYYGMPESSPFDAIIVTCAPDHVPQPLTAQLVQGGRMVIPVGPPGLYQTLWLIEKEGDRFITSNLGSVRFVPMLGDQ